MLYIRIVSETLMLRNKIRGYVTLTQIHLQQESRATKPRSPRLSVALSLDHFLQRQRALGLWRDIVRTTMKLKDDRIRTELKSFAKEEFARNKHIEDLTQIRYLLSTGKEQMKMMQRYVDEMTAI